MGISPQQFEQMKKRLEKPRPAIAAASRAATSLTQPKIIIGIDPSLRGTGYGVIRLSRSQPSAIAFGTLSCAPSWPHSRCLAHISQTLRQVIAQHRPEICVFEALFFAQNLQTALTMGEARGASLAAVAEAGIDIYEISPRKVKQAIVGYGAAQKLAVAKMVQRILGLAEIPPPDAADALAVALAHAQQLDHFQLEPARKL